MDKILLRLTFIRGLRDVVLNEISLLPDITVLEKGKEDIYLSFVNDIKFLFALRSVSSIYLVKRGIKLNPRYISNHKSILAELIEKVIGENEKGAFTTFKLRCAGSDSEESLEIQDFITKTYKLIKAEEADMEIYINKPAEVWELGVRLTPRPLSTRDYKIAHIKGGINPTIAYAMNTYGDLTAENSYLNVFSGSATLLIEAAQTNPKLKLVGFDIDGKTNSLGVKNIKQAGYIKQIQLKTVDIFTKPDLGRFDVIASDLPFGMQISKDEDLESLYKCFLEYCVTSLNEKGRLLVYTAESELFEKVLKGSAFVVRKKIELKIPTSVNSYLYPKIFVCEIK